MGLSCGGGEIAIGVENNAGKFLNISPILHDQSIIYTYNSSHLLLNSFFSFLCICEQHLLCCFSVHLQTTYPTESLIYCGAE
jgi:hypothetical protein